ncbi:MAG: PQQ-dependent dehydrogenase, methanol/ethanol family [Bryobacteraceae bacterium]|nr:PQQ-dependent dehydrogenase, methanol/ethanol family [Bryobacteraceae bacterium]
MRMPAWVLLLAIPLTAQERPAPGGKRAFETHCGHCHGGDAAGGERGPSLFGRLAGRNDADLTDLMRRGLPDRGMPPSRLTDEQARQITAYLRSLERPAAEFRRASVRLEDGSTIEGYILNESNYDLQIRDLGGRIHLLTKAAGALRRGKGDAVDWSTYHGVDGGNRRSPLKQITAANVDRLSPRWAYPIPSSQRLQTTPVVIGGIMYVTGANEVHALDAASGRRLWQWRRPRTHGLIGDAAGGINRGVAVRGDRVFLATDNARLVALNRFTGELAWDVEIADYRLHYGATSAPLVVGDLVISGTSGGDEGVRGVIAAFRAATGEIAWRFFTVPAPGEPGSETWSEASLKHGCAAAWLTGTYDAELNLLYWPTGNPCPDYNGDVRPGDNLYSSAVVALEPEMGKLRWYYQFTPHDVHDWDATQTPMLIDANYRGGPRKLLAQANRNGIFYVLDRTNGELLLAKPFVKKLTWASGVGKDGRPVLLPDSEPSIEGTKACPAVEGATNWMSTAYEPGTGLFYVQALEKCNIYIKTPGKWEPGKSYYDGSTRRVPGEPGQKILRAIDLESGRIAWEYPQTGLADSWGGVLATAGGLVFFGEDSGAFAAVDSKTGKPLWHFQTNQTWKASPMTYMADGRQYVAVAAGSNVLAFALTD